MKPENKTFLDANRHHYDTIVKAGYVRGLNAHEREGMQRVMGEEFQPGYHTDLWCGPCLFDMVKLLYQRYDAWIAANEKPSIPLNQEEINQNDNAILSTATPEEKQLESATTPNTTNATSNDKAKCNEPDPPNSTNTPQRNIRRRK